MQIRKPFLFSKHYSGSALKGFVHQLTAINAFVATQEKWIVRFPKKTLRRANNMFLLFRRKRIMTHNANALTDAFFNPTL